MIYTAAIGCALALVATSAFADEFSRQARSGQRALMRAYANFNISDCSPVQGTVNVVTKPRHGTLSTVPGPYTIDVNRFTGQRSRCAGKTITGLNVYYVPERGYRGTDNFTLRAVYRAGAFSVLDSFSVEVR